MKKYGRISNNATHRDQIEPALEFCNKVLNSSLFLDQVDSKRHDWEYLNGMPSDVRNEIENFRREPIEIRTYRNARSSALAYTYLNADYLYLNTAKFDRSTKSIGGSIAHEMMHCLGYGHGNNSRAGKQNSVPYWIGSAVRNFDFEGGIDLPPSPPRKYIPWYKRFWNWLRG